MDETIAGMLVIAIAIVSLFVVYALYRGVWSAAMFGIGMITVTAIGGMFIHERY